MRALFEIYNIDARMLACINEETGEILEPEKLEELGLERNRLIEELGRMHKNEKYLQVCLKNEIEKLKANIKKSKNRIRSIEKALRYKLKGEKFESASVKISFTKSSHVEVDDINQLAADYLRYKEPEPEPNKKKIRESLNQGIHLNGVRLIEKQNIQIK